MTAWHDHYCGAWSRAFSPELDVSCYFGKAIPMAALLSLFLCYLGMIRESWLYLDVRIRAPRLPSCLDSRAFSIKKDG